MSNYICDCGQHYMSLAAVDACQAGHNGTLPCRECERKDRRIAELKETIRAMDCTCLPYPDKYPENMCRRCAALTTTGEGE